uniref:Thioredoxin domain-containing protein n=1 Tax=Marmota marmota marmota TaxID=9994 RepID=A0A8C5ZBE2_MARMA
MVLKSSLCSASAPTLTRSAAGTPCPCLCVQSLPPLGHSRCFSQSHTHPGCSLQPHWTPCHPSSVPPSPTGPLYMWLLCLVWLSPYPLRGLSLPCCDAVWVLDSGSVRGATANSSAAWLVQFYSSWCGHCIGYAPTWRALAGDVRAWRPVAALDCAEEKNQEVCRTYDVHFYPTFRVSPEQGCVRPALFAGFSSGKCAASHF